MGGEGGRSRGRSHSLITESRSEVMSSDGEVLYDYRAAHSRVDDAGYKLFLPTSCFKCRRQLDIATEAGRAPPTIPDQEELIDDS